MGSRSRARTRGWHRHWTLRIGWAKAERHSAPRRREMSARTRRVSESRPRPVVEEQRGPRRALPRGPRRGVDSCGSSHRPELAWGADLPLACLSLSPPFPYLGWVIQRAYTRPEVTADSPFVGAKFRDPSIPLVLDVDSFNLLW